MTTELVQLIVKGNVAQAIDAAISRVQRIHSAKTLNRESSILVVEADGWLISKWFCEPGQAPYPVGALLHYGPCKPGPRPHPESFTADIW